MLESGCIDGGKLNIGEGKTVSLHDLFPIVGPDDIEISPEEACYTVKLDVPCAEEQRFFTFTIANKCN